MKLTFVEGALTVFVTLESTTADYRPSEECFAAKDQRLSTTVPKDQSLTDFLSP